VTHFCLTLYFNNTGCRENSAEWPENIPFFFFKNQMPTANHTISKQSASAGAIWGTLKHIKCETQKFPDWPRGALTGCSKAVCR